MLETLGQDVKFAVRLLRQSPLFTLTASLSLAIGIGANATIFGVASAMLLRPMPGLADSERLMDIGRTQEGDGFDTVSYPNYRDFKERTKLFEDVYAIRLEPQAMSLGGPGGAERVYGTTASANYFSVLGATAHVGRLLHADDDAGAGRLVAVISHDLWQRRFGADPSIAGRSILINTHPFTVVGVAPRGFQGTTLLKPELWVPISAVSQVTPRGGSDPLTSRAVGVAVHGRQTQTGCFQSPGQRRGTGDRRRVGARVSPAEPRQEFHRRPDSPRPRPGRHARRIHRSSHGHRRPRTAGGVRQRRRHAPGARGGAAARDRRATGDRRQPRPSRPPAPH